MTARLVGGIAAASLAVGILVGAAGAIVVRGDSTPDLGDHLRQMSGMMAMMGAGGSVAPEDHAAHHGLPTPEPTR